MEDYSCLIEGLLELYQTTFDPRWSLAAQELAETMLEPFADSEGMLYEWVRWARPVRKVPKSRC